MVIAGVSALVAHAVQGPEGLRGACVGIGIAFCMCAASAWLLRWSSRARGQALVAGMLGSVASSFLILIAGIILVSLYWRPLLESAALTALATYLGYRFLEAFTFASFSRATSSRSHGGSV